MNRALLIIDYTRDAVEQIGEKAQDIRVNIQRAINVLGPDDLLILANEQGGESQIGDEVENCAARAITISKTRHSAFFDTALKDILKIAGADLLFISGVGISTGVLHSAIDAYNLGLSAAVLTDCITPQNGAGSIFALSHIGSTLKLALPTSKDL